jgi:hypothetical protein
MIAERRGIMSGGQIDRLCREWLRENYGESIASEYTTYSLVIPMWNPADLNDALEDLRMELCLSFGPEQSFGSTDYYEAREKLGLSGGWTPIPDVFIRAFATK